MLCFLVLAHPDYPGLKGRKTVVVVLMLCEVSQGTILGSW